ncbi:TonB-dependent receptor plug domain-containing protein [Roseateles depolymerans]|uniref:Uncharacterized protein n=1 Tax=Roseateles depolymerans TaxID=76731 RepID=A0A0U2TYF1_9BURK|nr:TonB-dependent receptor plug domain-containing protein [Roseateles depolymerans]ALV05185.1 hypothetical protein RD2015_689 [Roseateles depolymerans]REG14799.1 outer membrane receptor protein involved in Fe transport [Roseateles depolymerans]
MKPFGADPAFGPLLAALPTALLLPLSATAADTPTAEVAPRVVVQGEGLHSSSLTVAGQIEVVRRADLLKFGQGSLGEALSRSGSIAIIPGRNGAQEITLSGLGDGYTQILLNGARAPRGFSIDTLSVDAIERVEISRTTSAETSARGIAGTINIILKRTSNNRETATLKSSVSGGWVDGHSIDGSYSFANESGSIALQASERRTDVMRSTRSALVDQLPGAAAIRSQEVARGPATTHEQSLAPKAEWRDERRSATLEGLYQRSHQQRHTTLTRWDSALPDGGSPVSGATDSRINRETWSASALYRQDDWLTDHVLDARLTAGSSRRLSEGTVVDETAAPEDRDRAVRYPSLDRTFGVRLRTQSRADAPSRLTLGLQYDRLHRSEQQTILAGTRTDDDYGIENTDLALFASWTHRLAGGDELQAGLRQERISFAYEENQSAAMRRRFAYWIPQAAWQRKLAEGGPTINLALTRSIRLPDEADFSSRTYLAVFNGPASPDQRGNPTLRPETAGAIELGLALPKGAPFELKGSLAYKHLDHVIVQELLYDESWVSRPRNAGKGRLWTSSVSLRHPFQQQASPGLKGSGSLSLSTNGSSVALPDGTRSRLPNAAPYQISIGGDLQGGNTWPWSAGLQWTYRAPTHYRLLGGASMSTGSRRTLDLYGSTRLAKTLTARMTLANVAQRAQQRSYVFDQGGRLAESTSRIRDGATVRLALEWSM